MSAKAWWGFDVDATIAKFNVGDNKDGNAGIGEPIKPLIRRMKYYIRTGRKVALVTARVHPSNPSAVNQRAILRAFLLMILPIEYALQVELRCDKDWHMIALYDDRAEQVIPNKGILVREELRRAVEGLQKIVANVHYEPYSRLIAQDTLASLDMWSVNLVSN